MGAGVEHAFTDMISARVEYRYSDYGDEDFGLGFGDFDVDEHAVRVGVMAAGPKFRTTLSRSH